MALNILWKGEKIKMDKDYDFSGWATKNNLKCSDGRTILKDAFKHDDGVTVPLVWNHQHNDPINILGHALLENRDEGVYAYCKFNETDSGKNAKILVEHGDVSALSIYANHLNKPVDRYKRKKRHCKSNDKHKEQQKDKHEDVKKRISKS